MISNSAKTIYEYYVTVDNVLKSITPNTKVISLAHITNTIGDKRPIKEICEIALTLIQKAYKPAFSMR